MGEEKQIILSSKTLAKNGQCCQWHLIYGGTVAEIFWALPHHKYCIANVNTNKGEGEKVYKHHLYHTQMSQILSVETFEHL